MLSTAVPLFAVAQGIVPLWVGVLVALPNALPVVLGMRAGGWVDRGGAYRWLMIGASGIVWAPLLLAVAPGAIALAVAQVLLGLFQLFAALASQSYVTGLAPAASLERDYATYATVLSAGRLVGPVVVGLVIDTAGFRPAFATAAAAFATSLAIVLALRHHPASGRGEADAPRDIGAGRGEADPERDAAAGASSGLGRGSDGRGGDGVARPAARTVWRHVGVQLAVLASAGMFVAIAARQAFLPVVLEARGYSATEVGTLVSLGAFASVAARPFMPVVSRALGGPARTLVAALATAAVAVGLLGLAASTVTFAALVIAAGAATGVALPLGIVTVAREVGQGARGAALGLRLSSNRAAQLVTPILVGAVVGTAGFGVGFGVVGATLTVAASIAIERAVAFERHGTRDD